MTSPTLPRRHLAALSWFVTNQGRELSWPAPLSDGTLLVTRAKGIYKPAWTPYALSVRHSLTGPYADANLEFDADGSWSYDYFQEGLDPNSTNDEYTNMGLIRCSRDGVPVGVLRQTRRKPQSRYLVLGIALVDPWDQGYFHLRSTVRIPGQEARPSDKLP